MKESRGWIGATMRALKEAFGFLPPLKLEAAWVKEELSKRMLGPEDAGGKRENGAKGRWVLVWRVNDSDKAYAFGVMKGTFIFPLGSTKEELLWNEGIPVALLYDIEEDRITGWMHFAEIRKVEGSSGYSLPLRPLEEFYASADLRSLAEKEQRRQVQSGVSSR